MSAKTNFGPQPRRQSSTNFRQEVERYSRRSPRPAEFYIGHVPQNKRPTLLEHSPASRRNWAHRRPFSQRFPSIISRKRQNRITAKFLQQPTKIGGRPTNVCGCIKRIVNTESCGCFLFEGELQNDLNPIQFIYSKAPTK